MLKNKNLLISIGVLVVILLIGGGYFLFANQKPAKPAVKQTNNADLGVQKLNPEDVGLKLTSSPDSQKIKYEIGKLNGIKAISYELTYEADTTEQERSDGSEPRIQRGITGDAEFKSGENSYSSPWLDLGSCSKNVCKYDKGVKSIDMIFKITKTDNGIYSVEESLEF